MQWREPSQSGNLGNRREERHFLSNGWDPGLGRCLYGRRPSCNRNIRAVAKFSRRPTPRAPRWPQLIVPQPCELGPPFKTPFTPSKVLGLPPRCFRPVYRASSSRSSSAYIQLPSPCLVDVDLQLGLYRRASNRLRLAPRSSGPIPIGRWLLIRN